MVFLFILTRRKIEIMLNLIDTPLREALYSFSSLLLTQLYNYLKLSIWFKIQKTIDRFTSVDKIDQILNIISSNTGTFPGIV